MKNNRVKRQKNHKFFVEGTRAISQLINSDWEIDALLYSSERELSNWAKQILNNSKAKIHYDLKYSLMQKLSNKENTSEIIALAYMAKDNLSRIKINKDMLVVILDRPASPGNLGTIIRSCNSFNVAGIIITGHAVDLYDPHTIQGSIGSLFSTPVIRCESHQDVIKWLEKVRKELGIVQVVGTSAKANKFIKDQDFTKPTVVLIGNESTGLSHNYKILTDELVKIPIHGTVSSLNVGCATSIFLYEIARQRGLK